MSPEMDLIFDPRFRRHTIKWGQFWVDFWVPKLAPKKGKHWGQQSEKRGTLERNIRPAFWNQGPRLGPNGCHLSWLSHRQLAPLQVPFLAEPRHKTTHGAELWTRVYDCPTLGSGQSRPDPGAVTAAPGSLPHILRRCRAWMSWLLQGPAGVPGSKVWRSRRAG